jgi:hypothetical protein
MSESPFPPVLPYDSFPQPENLDTGLWRYLDDHKFKWLIESKRLYIGLVQDMVAAKNGDPFEGTTPKAESAWWQKQIDEARGDEKSTLLESWTFVRNARTKYSNHVFVTCWHMNDHENFGMWPAYTTSPNSVAIKTSYRRLHDALAPYIFIGCIRYIDYARERLRSWNMLDALMHKRIGFEYEKEARVVAMSPATQELGLKDFCSNLFEKDDDTGNYIFAPEIPLAELIDTVVLHPDCTAEFAAKVGDLCKVSGLKEPIPSTRKDNPNG